MKLGITHNIVQVAGNIRSVGSAANRALVSALNSTAQSIKQGELDEMRKVFDRPTPYALNSLYIRPARPRSLTAEVLFKDELAVSKGGVAATKFLTPEVEGGTRRQKGMEVALARLGLLPVGFQVTPGPNAKLDGYGNVSGAFTRQVLAQLRAAAAGPPSRRRIIAAVRRAAGRYFVVPPGSKAGLKPGIYLRELVGSRSPLLVFKIVRRANYRKRFPFYGVAQEIADARVEADFNAALIAALAE